MVFKINEERLSVYVRAHRKFSKKVAKKYWSNLLNISPARVLVYTHFDSRSRFNKQWSKYGIATLQFHSKRLRSIVDSKIEKEVDNLLGKKHESRSITT